jgi:hypothetical protein
MRRQANDHARKLYVLVDCGGYVDHQHGDFGRRCRVGLWGSAMSAATLDRLCSEAMQRLAYFVARSAGQHCRAIRSNSEKYRETTK